MYVRLKKKKYCQNNVNKGDKKFMKKYVLFFISIGVILGAILIFNVAHIEESKKETFSESGYILNGSTNRYYFYQDETYTTSYNKQIVFYDTEGTKVTIDDSNFIHYTSGNIVAFKQNKW